MGTKEKDPFFIDKWCAKNVRKVSFCSECMHYQECLEAGHSLSPRAMEHNLANKKMIDFDEDEWK